MTKLTSIIRFLRKYPEWAREDAREHPKLFTMLYNGWANKFTLPWAFLDFFFPYRTHGKEEYIRVNGHSSINLKGKTHHTYFTFRACFRHYLIGMPLLRLRRYAQPIVRPRFAFAAVALALIVLFGHAPEHKQIFAGIGAVALDAAASTGFISTGTTLTLAHTVTGSNLVMLIGLADYSQNLNADAQWNGGATTDLYTHLTDYDRYSWYKFAPTTGSHNVVAGFSGTLNAEMGVTTYTGVDQGGFDAQSTAELTGSGTKTFSVTTVADNCWVHGICLSTGGLSGITTGTERWNNSDGSCAGDSGPKTPAGSVSIATNQTAGGTRYTNGDLVSMKPASTSAIKTVNGLAKASVKTYNGLAIASVKSINGLQ